jgi:hypothetical protein
MFVLVLTLLHVVCCPSATTFHLHNVMKWEASQHASISSLSGDLQVDLHLRIICYHCASKANMLFSGRSNVADNSGHFTAISFMPTRTCSRVRLTVTYSHQDSCCGNSSHLVMEGKYIVGSARPVSVN